MTDNMIASTLERLERDVKASRILMDAAAEIGMAMLLNRETDLAPGGHEAQAFITESLEHLVRRQALTLRDRANARATQLGWLVATYEIAPEAKNSGTEPVVFITGNSYMPPLRDLAVSEAVWNLEGDWYGYYADAIETRLAELHVYMACPEYDNSLYVVDLERFQHNEDADGDSLANEWEPIVSD